jgi:hypothetical protein
MGERVDRAKNKLREVGSSAKTTTTTTVNQIAVKLKPERSTVMKVLKIIVVIFAWYLFVKPMIIPAIVQYDPTGITDTVLATLCGLGNQIVIMDKVTNWFLPCVQLYPELTSAVGDPYSADVGERSDIKKYTDVEVADIAEVLGFQDFNFTAETGEELSTADKQKVLAAQMRAVWDTQYSGSSESILDQGIDFKIAQVRLDPEGINGWKRAEQEEISIGMKVQNIGTKKIDVVGWFNCTAPRGNPDICEAAGFSYECEPLTEQGTCRCVGDHCGCSCDGMPCPGEGSPCSCTNTYPDILTAKCPYDDLGSTGEYYSCSYYTEIQSNGFGYKICDDVLVGTDETNDLNNRIAVYSIETGEQPISPPYPWCFTVIAEGGTTGSSQAYVDGYAVTEFLARADATLQLIDEDVAEALILMGKINFLKPLTVNKESPVKFAFDTPEAPYLVRESNDFNYLSINYETQGEGTIRGFLFYVVKLSDNLESQDYTQTGTCQCVEEYCGCSCDGKSCSGDGVPCTCYGDWTCVDETLFTDSSHTKKRDVAECLMITTDDIDDLINDEYEYEDDVIQALWDEYKTSDEKDEGMTYCFLNLSDREFVSVLENLQFRVKSLPENQDRDTAIITLDAVYNFESQLGPAVLSIDCSYSAFKEAYYDWIYEDKLGMDFNYETGEFESDECRKVSDWSLTTC